MKPQLLCKLTKGKALGAFDGFVDTFNWLVDFCNNLCGDKNKDDSGHIVVDNIDADHPTIRFEGELGGLESDNTSINERSDGKTQIYGWSTQQAIGSSVAFHLNSEYENEYEVLVRTSPDDPPIYMPIGNGMRVYAGSNISVTPSGFSFVISASGAAAGVSSLNGLSGSVSIVGSGATTVTQSGSVITVNSTDTDTGFTSITINGGSGITVVPSQSGRSISFDISAHYI